MTGQIYKIWLSTWTVRIGAEVKPKLVKGMSAEEQQAAILEARTAEDIRTAKGVVCKGNSLAEIKKRPDYLRRALKALHVNNTKKVTILTVTLDQEVGQTEAKD